MGEGAAYISKKQSWLRFALSLSLAAGIAALLCLLFREPRLGSLYDLLLRRRPAIPIAQELLIVDTILPISDFDMQDNILEPSAVASLLMTMSEFDASVLILQAPVLGISAGSSAREEEIRYRFDREFTILNRNIRNLFDAIRTGSIAPGESALYVAHMVELSERGKERLITALISRDEEGIAQLERAAAIFGNVHRPGDLLVQLIGTEGRPGALADHGEYSRSRPDRDGRLRRIVPQGFAVDGEGRTMEHIIYSALKPRFQSSDIRIVAGRKFLVLEDEIGSRSIPLDQRGALLFEVPRRPEDFRRIPMAYFLEYDEADKSLRFLLGEAEAQGIYALIQGEDNPIHLYDFALSLRAELLMEDLPFSIMEELKIRWKMAREAYFAGLENFLYGPSELSLVGGLEQSYLILDSEEAEHARMARDAMIRTFAELRGKYQELLGIRTRLDSNLRSAFCILGPAGGLGDAEASALLANSIITGRAVNPARELWLFLGSLAAAFLTALILFSRGAIHSLCYGFILTFLTGLGFSLSFLFTGYWLDPRIPIASAGTVSLVYFFWALLMRFQFAKLFRSCYGPFIAQGGLKYLIRSGAPKPEDIVSLHVAVVAIRNPSLSENSPDPKSAAASVLFFRGKLSKAIQRAGGTVAGNAGDLVLACFGSPLERIISVARSSVPTQTGANAIRAAGFITDLLRHKENKALSFGLDFGLCAFTWSPLSGYSVFGGPVAKARLLSGLRERYNAQVLISASVSEVLPDFPVKQIGAMKGKGNSESEAFYELLI